MELWHAIPGAITQIRYPARHMVSHSSVVIRWSDISSEKLSEMKVCVYAQDIYRILNRFPFEKKNRFFISFICNCNFNCKQHWSTFIEFIIIYIGYIYICCIFLHTRLRPNSTNCHQNHCTLLLYSKFMCVILKVKACTMHTTTHAPC